MDAPLVEIIAVACKRDDEFRRLMQTYVVEMREFQRYDA